MAICWLIEAPNPADRYTDGVVGPRGYLRDINTSGTFDIHMTTDPFKAMKFHSRNAAQDILDDSAFIHAMGDDKGFVVVEHMFYDEEPK